MVCSSILFSHPKQHLFSFFKTLVGKVVIVELKNGLQLRGVLQSVDQYLNVKLENIEVVHPEKYPHMIGVIKCFIRGSVIRYVHLTSQDVDLQLLQDSSRRANRPQVSV